MLEIGKIVGFHGLKGEVKIPYSDRLLRNLEILKQLYVFTTNKDFELLDIETYRVHKTNVLVKFKQYSGKDQVLKFKGARIKQNEDLLAPLEKEEYFIKDLIGIDVYDESDILIGKVNSILTEAASNDIIEIKTNDDKIKLIPFVNELVPVVNISNNKIVIKNIPGLLDD